MALSKKHYEQIAYSFKQQIDAIAAAKAEFYLVSDQDIAATRYLRQLAEKLALDFAIDNPRFDRERFLKACGF